MTTETESIPASTSPITDALYHRVKPAPVPYALGEMHELCESMEEQRNELLAALKEALFVADEVHDHGCASIPALVPCDCYLSRMRSAIAMAEGKVFENE